MPSALARISTSPTHTVCAVSPCSAPLYSTLERQCGAAVVDEQAVLEVLTGIREVDAEALERAAGAGVGGVGVEPHDAAADGDGDVPHGGVAPDDQVVLGEVVGVVVPLLHGDQGDLRAVAGDDGDDLAVLRGAGVLEHDGGAGEPADPHQQVAVHDLVRRCR